MTDAMGTDPRLALCLEDLFALELPDAEVEGFETLGDVVSYFSRRYFRDAEDLGEPDCEDKWVGRPGPPTRGRDPLDARSLR